MAILKTVFSLVFILIVLTNTTGLSYGYESFTIPKTNSTQQQYCWNGTCQTPNGIFNGIYSSNDTNHESRSRYNIIMVVPSEGCTNAIKYHAKTSCAPLQNITKYDTSNQKISGYFYSPDGKILERTKPEVKNHWQFYTYSNKTVVCVYCTGNYLTTDLYKTIILGQADNFSYAPKIFRTGTYTVNQFNATSGSFKTLVYPSNEIDTGLTILSNRQIDKQCNTATISYSDFLLNDTINYMKSGCKVTHFNKTMTSKVPNTPWNYNNPYSTLHYIAALKEITGGYGIFGTNQTMGGHGLGNCQTQHCTATTSTRKPGY